MLGSDHLIDVLLVGESSAQPNDCDYILRELGANVLNAATAEDAVGHVAKREPALVLLDVQIAGPEAYETAAAIRACRNGGNVPILFLTSLHDSQLELLRGYSLGGVDYLLKPVLPEILRSKASFFLDLHRKREEVRRQAELLREAAEREHVRALERARAEWERAALRRNNERLRLLADTASGLLCEQNPRQHLAKVCEDLVRHLDLELALCFLLESSDGPLSQSCSVDITNSLEQAVLSGAAQNRFIQTCVEQRQTCVASAIEASDSAALELFESLRLRTFACFPLSANYRPLGALFFGSGKRIGFREEELALMGLVSDQLAMALDRARLITELESGTVELKEADRRKNQFLAMLAHELRNPLTPIVNALQIIRLEGRQTPDLERALEAAERQADHMVGMIDDLLDVARITRGKIQLRKDTVALASIMETAVQASRQLILDKRHDLRLVMPEQAVFVQADPMRLSQIVSNLVNNAGRYTADGGKIEVTCEVEGRELAIHVRDSGIGISAEMIEHIFDSFVQVSPTSDRSAGGLGIGLTLVRTLAELHGGTAYAFSEGRGRGSEFIVRLPVVTQEEPRPVSNTQVRHSGAVPANDARLVIALVDDNDDIRFTMRALLELWGHRVEEAFDGPSGIDLIERVQPHLALVDLGLPGYDGFEVARRAAELTASRTFLIALSGYGGEDVEQRAREVGFFAHLLKPIDPRRLLALLKVMQEAPGSGEALKQRALSPGA